MQTRAAAAPLYQVPRVVPAPVAMDTDTEEEEGEEREEGEEEGVMVVMEVVEEGQGERVREGGAERPPPPSNPHFFDRKPGTATRSTRFLRA